MSPFNLPFIYPALTTSSTNPIVAEYEDWNRRYDEATYALHDREELVDRVSSELERDLHLLGATAIEDKLQDGVPETIADLSTLR